MLSDLRGGSPSMVRGILGRNSIQVTESRCTFRYERLFTEER